MKEQITNLLTRLEGLHLPDKAGSPKAAQVHAACQELRHILMALEANDRVDRTDLAPRILQVTITLAEAGLLDSPPAEHTPRQASTELRQNLLEWARQQFTEDEIVAGIQEIRQTGGIELHEFISELEGLTSANGRTTR